MIKMKSNWFNEAMAALIILRYGGCSAGCLRGSSAAFFFGLRNCTAEDFFLAADVARIDRSHSRDPDAEELEIDC